MPLCMSLHYQWQVCQDHSIVWCDVVPCSLVHMHQCFIELCCFCLPSWKGREDVPPKQWHTFIATRNHITIRTAVSTSDLNKHITWNHQILDTDVPQFSNNSGVSNMVLCIFLLQPKNVADTFFKMSCFCWQSTWSIVTCPSIQKLCFLSYLSL